MSSRTVLIVDDDREAALGMSRALAAAPHLDVKILEHAEAIVTRTSVAPVDLVITDAACASGLSGLDVVRTCKAAAPATRILLVSGNGSLDDAVGAVRAGAFVTSPSRATSTRSRPRSMARCTRPARRRRLAGRRVFPP